MSGPTRAMLSAPSLWVRPVRDVRSSAMGGNGSALRRKAGLDDFDFHRVVGLIVQLDGAMKPGVFVASGIHVAQEVRAGERRFV